MKKLIQFRHAPVSWVYFCLFAGLTGLFAFNVFERMDQKTVSVAAEKMNVLFIGVENPLTVAVEGMEDDKVALASDDVEITKTGRGQYIVKALKPGNAAILVYGKGFEPKELIFRVKRLPEPIAVLNNDKSLNWREGGALNPEEFKESKGMALTMSSCFYFGGEPAFEITGFSMVCVSKRDDPVEVVNRRAEFNEKTKELIAKATPGDMYYFENVMARISGTGDDNLVKLNSLAFKIQ